MRRLCFFTALSCALTLLSSCSSAGPAADGGSDAARACHTDADCDDRLFCTGVDSCVGGMCVSTPPPCDATQQCVEAARRCLTVCATTEDADHDGARATECGGLDCDDSDPDRRPGNPEVCDTAMHDEDCDPTTFGFRDADGDGYPDARCCNVDAAGGHICGNDCNDTMPGQHPGLAEVCNGIDDDCDTAIDEGLLLQVYVDADHDGHGALGALPMQVCMLMPDLAQIADDCDDTNAMRFPGNPEVCDAAMIDEDCSGVGNDVPGGCACTGTSVEVCGTMGRCTGATHTCMDGQWTPCTVVPATEVCDMLTDEDCDGTIDEGLTTTCFRDGDGDGYPPDGAAPQTACLDTSAARMVAPWNGCPSGMTSRAPGAGTVDCCDSDGRAHPGGTAQTSPSACAPHFDFDCDGAETIAMTTTAGICGLHPDSGSCNNDHTSTWCGASAPGCGGMAGYSSGGCWWGSSCQATICWPTTMPCR